MLVVLAVLLVIVMTLPSSVSSVAVYRDAFYDAGDAKGSVDEFGEIRSKRGALKLTGKKITNGVKAMRILLSGAKKVPPTDILRREYVKSGGAERATRDFYSVKPKNIRAADDQKILIGEIGDNTILLMRPGAYGNAKTSSLLIYKTDERDLPYSIYAKIIYEING